MKPTLEEVKAYFKNAKEVKLLNTNFILDISNAEIVKNSDNYFFAKVNGRIISEGYHNTLFSGMSREYAEIISYKDTYTVSKEFILDLHENVIWPSVRTKIENEFPDLFKKPKTKLTISEIEDKLGYEIEIVK
jgi:hypothetical protein